MVSGSPVFNLMDGLHVAAHVGEARDPAALVASNTRQLEDLALAGLEVSPVHVPVAVDAEHAHGFVGTKAPLAVETLATLLTQELEKKINL